MFKRFSTNYALLSVAIDSLATIAALMLTNVFRVPWLRMVWPENWYHEQGKFVPPHLWPIVALLWWLIFIFTSVYDPKRNYKAVDEFQNVILAADFARLTLAGSLYLSSASSRAGSLSFSSGSTGRCCWGGGRSPGWRFAMARDSPILDGCSSWGPARSVAGPPR